MTSDGRIILRAVAAQALDLSSAPCGRKPLTVALDLSSAPCGRKPPYPLTYSPRLVGASPSSNRPPVPRPTVLSPWERIFGRHG
ncbi:MAG: hypothetical protein RSE97_07700, partial [Oscillospiraceae bacterium]